LHIWKEEDVCSNVLDFEKTARRFIDGTLRGNPAEEVRGTRRPANLEEVSFTPPAKPSLTPASHDSARFLSGGQFLEEPDR